MRPSRIRTAVIAAAATALVVSFVGTSPAVADHTSVPARVTLMGDLMSELGCPDDWAGGCAATDLTREAGSETYSGVFDVPAGSWQWKVRLNGSWDENYGDASGTFGLSGNMGLVLAHEASLRFLYDHTTHRTWVEPAGTPAPLAASDRGLAATSLRTDLTRERFYFVMADRFANGTRANDRGGYTGDRLQTGYDPASKGFYHGGDLKGLLQKLDYIQGLGTTAIWMTPSFKNKPVQGSPGKESAGYHGYWITDFTTIDPHLGTNADLKTLIDAAHARGLKVFFDIITNHTADVLDYPDSAYQGALGNESVPYVSKEQQPYRDAQGNAFDDRDPQYSEQFPAIDANTSFPYVPVMHPGDENVKVPAWLNDPTMYHNRGTSSFAGEDSEYGDFPSGDRSALDDLWTERPEVVTGMEDIYKTWVKDAGVDGFRIDTVKHVDLAFWQKFAPALKGFAASLGNDDFFMFGEVYDANPASMSRYTTSGKLQATVDFGFQASATAYAKGDAAAGASAVKLQQFFASDDWFTDQDSNAYSLPTFLGNHDMGRIGKFLSDTGATGPALLQRDQLAHALMFTTRGQPVVYYGDEQGFTGDGGDQDARQDMFASQVASYNDDDLIGTTSTTATSSYDTTHPMYRLITSLSALRAKYPTLADGAQIHRYAADGPGIYAFSRIAASDDVEYVVAANSANTKKTAKVPTYSADVSFTQIWPTAGWNGGTNAGGRAAIRSDSAKQIAVEVPARSVVVYRATKPLRADSITPVVSIASPAAGSVLEGRTAIGVDLAVDDFAQATVLWRGVGTKSWTRLGTDDNAPYRVFHDVSGMPKGSLLEYRVVVKDHDGDLGVASTWGIVGKAPVVVPPVGPVVQPQNVSIPGSHGSEIGCPDSSTDGGTNPGDWDPTCAQAQLALDPADQIWKGTRSPATGGYAFKAAIDKSWDENYGVGGIAGGADVGYTSDGSPVTFYYDHRTHWVTNTRISDIVVATGSFQSELGCPTDSDVACMRAWLQDPDGNKVFSLGMTDVPVGTYSVQVARNGTLEGSAQTFTVADGEVTTFTYDPSVQTLSVTTTPAA